jgi:hypothetical protein
MTVCSSAVAVIGNDGRAPDGLWASTESLFQFAGRNTGNVAFWYAVSRHIADDKKYCGWNADPADINANCKALVVVAANWLYEHFDIGPIGNILERVEVPTIVVGLGAQLPHREHPLVLKEGTERFVSVLAKRNIPVGVRGSMTTELLKKRGVENTFVIGCPSNLINPTHDFQDIIENRFDDPINRAVLCPEVNRSHIELNRHLISLVGTVDWMCVVQDPIEPVSSILSRQLVDTDAEGWFRSGLLSGGDGKWRETFLKRFRVYFDAVTWMHELRMHDLAIGAKFHGNMLAFQAGTPAIFIMHDTRTEELANALLLPRVSKEVFLSAGSLDDVLKLKIFDSGAYAERRRAIGRQYSEVLTRTGIDVSTELLAMAGVGG